MVYILSISTYTRLDFHSRIRFLRHFVAFNPLLSIRQSIARNFLWLPALCPNRRASRRATWMPHPPVSQRFTGLYSTALHFPLVYHSPLLLTEHPLRVHFCILRTLTQLNPLFPSPSRLKARNKWLLPSICPPSTLPSFHLNALPCLLQERPRRFTYYA